MSKIPKDFEQLHSDWRNISISQLSQLSEVFNLKKTFLKFVDCCTKSPDFVSISIG
jgi:hypothetical protein